MQHEIQLQHAIAKKSSFMSKTMWKYLFSLINELDRAYVVKIKLLLDNEIRAFNIPQEKNFINGKYLEEYWGVFELKEIEWIFIPSQVIYKKANRNEILTPKVVNQDMDIILSIFCTGKQFEYDRTDKGLTIYGYK